MNHCASALRIRMTDQDACCAPTADIVQAINECRELNTFIPALAYTFARTRRARGRHEERAAALEYSYYRLVRLNFDL